MEISKLLAFTLTIQEAGVATGTIEYQKMQIKLGGKLSGDIKISDKIQPIKTEKKDSDNNVSLQSQLKMSKINLLVIKKVQNQLIFEWGAILKIELEKKLYIFEL